MFKSLSNLKKYFLVYLLLVSLLVGAVFADSFYADVVVDVQSSGEVIFSGITNNPSLKGNSFEFTSKTQKFWLLNISFEETFSEALIQVNLPKGAEINYVRSSGSFGISSVGSRPSVKILHNDKPLEVLIQYSLPLSQRVSWNYFFVFALILFGVGLFLLFKFRKKKLVINYKGVNERQKRILELLSKGDLTQKELEDFLKIPKASLSRNVDSLVRKELIEKKQTGMTNTLSIKKTQ